MKEQCDDYSYQKSAKRKVADVKKAGKERLRAQICARAMKRKASESNTEGVFEPSEGRCTPKKRGTGDSADRLFAANM